MPPKRKQRASTSAAVQNEEQNTVTEEVVAVPPKLAKAKVTKKAKPTGLKKYTEYKVTLNIKERPDQMQDLIDIFKNLEHPNTIKNMEFTYEYDDCDPPLLKFDVDLHKYLPCIEKIVFESVFVEYFNLRSKSLKRMAFNQTSAVPIPGKFEFNCPNLEAIQFEYVYLEDASKLGSSFSNSPKLKSITAYKLYGMDDNMGPMYLPSCTDIDLTRCDGLFHMSLYAPKLEGLSISYNYELSSLEFLTEGLKAHAKFNPGKKQKPSRFFVNFVNNIAPELVKELKKNPRVCKVFCDQPFMGGWLQM